MLTSGSRIRVRLIRCRSCFKFEGALVEIEQFFFHRLRLPCCYLFATDALAAVVAYSVGVRRVAVAGCAVFCRDVSHKAEQVGCSERAGVRFVVSSEISAARPLIQVVLAIRAHVIERRPFSCLYLPRSVARWARFVFDTLAKIIKGHQVIPVLSQIAPIQARTRRWRGTAHSSVVVFAVVLRSPSLISSFGLHT